MSSEALQKAGSVTTRLIKGQIDHTNPGKSSDNVYATTGLVWLELAAATHLGKRGVAVVTARGLRLMHFREILIYI